MLAAPSIIPPVFLWDTTAGRLIAFPSSEAAAHHLAPWQEVGAIIAYDARGGRVSFAVERGRSRFLELLRLRREVIVVAGVERDPGAAEELRRALVAALARKGQDRAALEQLALGELVVRGERSLRRAT